MRRWLPIVVLAGVLAGAATVLVIHSGAGRARASPERSLILGATDLPASPPSALHVGVPRLLDRADTAVWAPVLRATSARSRPGGGEVIDQVGTRTPEGTQNLVLVVGERGAAGETWAKVRLPSLSRAGESGWLPRSTLGALHVVETQLRVDLTRLRLTLLVDGRERFQAPVGVGAAGTPTPTGVFYVRDKLTRYASPFYGPVAFGTSARSRVLTDWPAGGYIGIHGTNEPKLIPGRISHGCIRLRNRDILTISRLLPVGTPIVIEG